MTRLLDRLQAANMNPRGIQTWSQRVCEQIEAAFADVTGQIAAIAAAQAAAASAAAAAAAAQTTANTANTTANTANTAAGTAQTTANTATTTANTANTTATTANTTANTANTTATTANATADAVKKTDKISASWTSPGSVLSASDAGANATITIAAHARKYGDGTSLSVAGGSLTGKAYSTAYYIYYTDTTLADTTPPYTATTNANTAAPNAAPGRHYLGKVTTPAAAGAATSGGTTPPGGGYTGPGDIP